MSEAQPRTPFDPVPFPLAYEPGARAHFLDAVAAWIRSEPIRFLIATIPAYPADGIGPARPLRRPATLDDDDPRVAIRALDEMCLWREHGTAWDIRHGLERQLVRETLAHGSAAVDVIDAAEALGLRTDAPAEADRYDAVVALGGARLAPLMRTRKLKQELGRGVTAEHFVLLGAPRELNDSEEADPDVRAYAPDAHTEFDLMIAAGASELGIAAGSGQEEKATHQGDEFQSWLWHSWKGRPAVHAVSAPTSTPGVRADTAASLDFLAGGVERVRRSAATVPKSGGGTAAHGLRLRAGARVLLCTSAIYQTFQQLVAVRVLGAGLNCHVETMAFPIHWNQQATSVNLQTASLYLQEIRSTFQAALNLVESSD